MLYGGKNEDMIKKQGFLDDVFVLNLANELCWIRCQILGSLQPARASHQSFIVGTQLYVFGGNNRNGFCSSKFDILELGNPRCI